MGRGELHPHQVLSDGPHSDYAEVGAERFWEEGTVAVKKKRGKDEDGLVPEFRDGWRMA